MEDDFLKGVIGYSLGLLSTLPAIIWGFVVYMNEVLPGTEPLSESQLSFLSAVPPQVFRFMVIIGFVIALTSLVKYWILPDRSLSDWIS